MSSDALSDDLAKFTTSSKLVVSIGILDAIGDATIVDPISTIGFLIMRRIRAGLSA